MRIFDRSTQFKKDVKKALKQTSPKRDLEELKKIMDMLANDIQLPPEKRDHPLIGEWERVSRMSCST